MYYYIFVLNLVEYDFYTFRTVFTLLSTLNYVATQHFKYIKRASGFGEIIK